MILMMMMMMMMKVEVIVVMKKALTFDSVFICSLLLSNQLFSNQRVKFHCVV